MVLGDDVAQRVDVLLAAARVAVGHQHADHLAAGADVGGRPLRDAAQRTLDVRAEPAFERFIADRLHDRVIDRHRQLGQVGERRYVRPAVAVVLLRHQVERQPRVDRGRDVDQVVGQRIGREAGLTADRRGVAVHVLAVLAHARGAIEDQVHVERAALELLLVHQSAAAAEAAVALAVAVVVGRARASAGSEQARADRRLAVRSGAAVAVTRAGAAHRDACVELRMADLRAWTLVRGRAGGSDLSVRAVGVAEPLIVARARRVVVAAAREQQHRRGKAHRMQAHS